MLSLKSCFWGAIISNAKTIFFFLQQKGHLAEIQKLLVDFPDKTQYELESDKELARLQRKAR